MKRFLKHKNNIVSSKNQINLHQHPPIHVLPSGPIYPTQNPNFSISSDHYKLKISSLQNQPQQEIQQSLTALRVLTQPTIIHENNKTIKLCTNQKKHLDTNKNNRMEYIYDSSKENVSSNGQSSINKQEIVKVILANLKKLQKTNIDVTILKEAKRIKSLLVDALQPNSIFFSPADQKTNQYSSYLFNQTDGKIQSYAEFPQSSHKSFIDRISTKQYNEQQSPYASETFHQQLSSIENQSQREGWEPQTPIQVNYRRIPFENCNDSQQSFLQQNEKNYSNEDYIEEGFNTSRDYSKNDSEYGVIIQEDQSPLTTIIQVEGQYNSTSSIESSLKSSIEYKKIIYILDSIRSRPTKTVDGNKLFHRRSKTEQQTVDSSSDISRPKKKNLELQLDSLQTFSRKNKIYDCKAEQNDKRKVLNHAINLLTKKYKKTIRF